MGTTYIKRSPAHAGHTQSIEIGNSQSVAMGEYLVRDTDGRLRAAADTLNFVPMGICVGLSVRDSNAGTTSAMSDTGDTSATPPPEAIVNLLGGVYQLSVTGAASDADVGRPVYVTGGNTYTLTETSHLPAIGQVVRWITGTTCEVLLYPAAAMGAAKHAGDRKRNVCLATVSTLALRSATAADIAAITMRGWGKITRVWAKAGGFHAGHNAGSAALNLEIGSTDLSGGVVVVNHENIDASGDLASNISGTAVSGLNEFNDGDVVTLERATGYEAFTATAPVNIEIWADITYYGSDV